MIRRWMAATGLTLLLGAAMAQDFSVLEDQQGRISYALGVNFWNRLQDQSVVVDPEVFMRGFRDAQSGKTPLMSREEVTTVLAELQRTLLKQQRMYRQSGRPAGGKPTGPEVAAQHAADLSEIKVSFKLDPRLTRGMYMGERWVSPSIYSRVQEPGKPLSVDARVEGRDANGRPVKIDPQWIASDPDMVAVSAVSSGAFNIVVKRAGESRLKVTAAGVTRELAINAKSGNDAMQVHIVSE